MVEPGSFVAVMGAAYGPEALISASGANDPTIARHAASALGPDAVAVACRVD